MVSQYESNNMFPVSHKYFDVWSKQKDQVCHQKEKFGQISALLAHLGPLILANCLGPAGCSYDRVSTYFVIAVLIIKPISFSTGLLGPSAN